MMEAQTETVREQSPIVARLSAALHQAQAQGLLREPDAVRHLLLGIVKVLAGTVAGNARDPKIAPVLQSQVYWDYFEMDIKEALLGAFSWVDPAVYGAVRDVIDTTFSELKRAYRGS